jgi:hypothetical protein
VRKDIRKIGQAIRDAFHSSRPGFVASLGVIFFSLFVFAFADEPIAKIVQVPTYFDFRGNKLVWELKPISDVILHGPIDMVEGKPRAWFSNVLVVPNKKLIDDKQMDTLFPSLSLRGRNLSGAVFVHSDLRNVDFTGANLNDAVLDYAQLAGARFECATLYDRVTKPGWPQDGCTWLQRASFALAQLQGAKFGRARMHGAILIAANLQAADMSAAQLQGVMFTNAEMTGARLTSADLSSAFLDGAIMVGADFHNSQLQGVLFGDTLLQLSSFQHVASPSLDRAPLRIAKPLRDEENKNIDDQIAKYFLYTAVSPSPSLGNIEPVSAGFDPKSLNRFRKSVIASLVPAGVIARDDFETTYEQATEKKWSEIAAIAQKAPTTGAKEYLVEKACNARTGPLVNPSLIRSERVMLALPEAALEVIAAVKKPSNHCPGAQSLSDELKAQLGVLEVRLKLSVGSALRKSEIDGSGKPAAESSPDPPASQTVGVR